MVDPVELTGELKGMLAEKAREIGRLLDQEYGRPAPRRRMKPLDELVLTILSQHTSDANSGRAFRSLMERFESWEAVRDADPAEIADAIRSGGLARIKAVRIKELLLHLTEERGRPSLDFLCEMGIQAARGYLLGLRGVGPKTAACVLLFSCGLPAFPVDTHVHRVTRRLGLIPPDATAEEAHESLEGLIPPEEFYPFHINLIVHGRRVCKASRPRCEVCVLAARCDHFVGRQEGGSQPREMGDRPHASEQRGGPPIALVADEARGYDMPGI